MQFDRDRETEKRYLFSFFTDEKRVGGWMDEEMETLRVRVYVREG